MSKVHWLYKHFLHTNFGDQKKSLHFPTLGKIVHPDAQFYLAGLLADLLVDSVF